MAVGRGLCVLTSFGLVLAGAPIALAQDLARPFAGGPVSPIARPTGASIFSSAVSPRPADEGQGAPLDIRPSASALALAIKVEPQPKRVDVPLPPRPERPKAVTEKAQPAEQIESAVATANATPAPEPVSGGFFSWLASQSSEPDPSQRTQVASLGALPRSGTRLDLSDPYRPKRLPGNDPRDDDLEDEETRKLVEKQVPSVEIDCLKPGLMRLIRAAGENFKGTAVITSGFRDRGRRGSHHRKCEAADFFIAGVSTGQLTSFLRKQPGAGGVGTYCHTKSVHIDIGEPRDWRQCGWRRSFALREPVLQIGSR